MRPQHVFMEIKEKYYYFLVEKKVPYLERRYFFFSFSFYFFYPKTNHIYPKYIYPIVQIQNKQHRTRRLIRVYTVFNSGSSSVNIITSSKMGLFKF